MRVRDVARVELGAKNYDSTGLLDGRYPAALMIVPLPNRRPNNPRKKRRAHKRVPVSPRRLISITTLSG